MKIPKSVRIAGVEYEVVVVPGLMNDNVAAYGHIDYENSRIELSDSFGTEHQKRCRILWHEILHGIREASGLEIEDEERIVEMFARGIYQVLQDNGARLFDLKACADALPELHVGEMDHACVSALVGALCGGVGRRDENSEPEDADARAMQDWRRAAEMYADELLKAATGNELLGDTEV